MKLSEIAGSVVARRCALFAGAGLTADNGGTTWNELIELLKDKFHYSSPLKDNFKIVEDMYRKFGEENVYEAVKDRLKDAKIDDQMSKLVDLPWYSVFTTNYDLALENTLNEKQSLITRTIVRGNEYNLDGIQSEMLCVKLMGSLDIPYDQQGSMVLTSGDLAIAREVRGRIFEELQSHAANLSFLFVGYSFNDDLFFETLDRLRKNIGSPKNTYYAVFKDEPDEEKSYLLEQYNVEVIVADLKDFADKLSHEVAIRNPKDHTIKRISIGSDVAPIDSTEVPNFLSLYNPVLFEDLEEDVSADTFLRGKTDSFKPFGLNWHFQRKEIKEVVNTVLKQKKDNGTSQITVIAGNPGSGRTFVMLAAIYELIKKHRAIAIKIPSYAVNKIPSSEELSDFMEEISKSSKELGISGPERVILWAEYPLESPDVSQFKKITFGFEYPVSLLCEDFPASDITDNETQRDEQIRINVDVDLTEEQKVALAQYIQTIVREHRFPKIDEEETRRIINEEKKFLPIMYRTLDPARRSINDIVQETFNELQDPTVQTCVSFCALATSVNLDTPLAILRKFLGRYIRVPITYPILFDRVLAEAKAFLKYSEDLRTNQFVSIYHPLIAQYIVLILGENKMDEYLLTVAESADLRIKIEADFVSNLFINKGVNLGPRKSKPFSETGLERALIELKSRQPARPILHHLARFYEKNTLMILV